MLKEYFHQLVAITNMLIYDAYNAKPMPRFHSRYIVIYIEITIATPISLVFVHVAIWDHE